VAPPQPAIAQSDHYISEIPYAAATMSRFDAERGIGPPNAVEHRALCCSLLSWARLQRQVECRNVLREELLILAAFGQFRMKASGKTSSRYGNPGSPRKHRYHAVAWPTVSGGSVFPAGTRVGFPLFLLNLPDLTPRR